MEHRFAILDDNDRLLRSRLDALRSDLPGLVGERACAALLVGSVAEGRARDDSDVDVLLVLRSDSPKREHDAWWDRAIAPRLEADDRRYPIEPLFVARRSLRTSDPELRHALLVGIPLWDPEGLFGDESRPRA